jgi:divalent metal cation (Fe/Co/Zn/Cd) transporter
MKRAVRTIIGLVAGSLVVFGGLQIALEIIRHRVKHAETSPWQYVIGSILVALGAALFALGSKIAAQLTDDYDDEA